MKSKTAFTKKDLVVVLLCVTFLIINLGAVGRGGRRKAKEIVCLSNLRQWAAIFQAYTGENDGKFYQYGHMGGGGARWWINPCDRYLKVGGIGTCPMTNKSVQEGARRPFALAFKKRNADGTWIHGSYCPNGWFITLPRDPRDWGGAGTYEQHWHTLNIQNANLAPLFTDSQYHDAWPWDTNQPPQYEGHMPFRGMGRVTAARHNGGQNMIFADFSGRKVGFKELWTLKWSRPFHTDGPWTIAGGVQPEDWPEWMRNFKDF